MRALVTGAGSGFGWEVAQALHAAGWDVTGTCRTHRAVEETLPIRWQHDVDLRRGTHWVPASAFDALVNAAGLGLWAPLETVTTDEAEEQLDIHTLVPLRLARAVLPEMRRRGTGIIVNIGSSVDDNPAVGSGMYAASKAALRAWTRVLAREVRPFGIRVVLVEPGKYGTRYAANRRIGAGVKTSLGRAYLAAHEASVPPRERAGERDPAEVARVVLRVLTDPEAPEVIRVPEG